MFLFVELWTFLEFHAGGWECCLGADVKDRKFSGLVEALACALQL
jgi:hypothetical protein